MSAERRLRIPGLARMDGGRPASSCRPSTSAMATHGEFGAATEASQVVSAFADTEEGKTVLITGVGPNGLGAAIAQSIAASRPKLLILTGRTAAKVEAIAREVASSAAAVKVRTLLFDLSSLQSVAEAARVINDAAEPDKIDIVVNNAAVMNILERQVSVDGFEIHLATNYLGLACFTMGILAKVRASAAGRIVNMASNGYALSPFCFADYNSDGEQLPREEWPHRPACEAFDVPWGLGYVPQIAYGQSKTASILCTRELAERLSGSNVTVACVNPGVIATDIWRQMPRERVDAIMHAYPSKSLTQGASKPLVVALDPKLKESPGAYLEDCQVADVLPFARDKAAAARLWQLTDKLAGKGICHGYKE